MRLLQSLILVAIFIGLLSIGRTYGAQPGTLRWVIPTGGTVNSSPAIAEDGTIYFAITEGPGEPFGRKVYSISPAGMTNWIFLAGFGSDRALTIGSDASIYVASLDGYVYNIAPAGTTNWLRRFGQIGDDPSSIALDVDGTIYVSWRTYGQSFYTNKFISFTPQGQTNWILTLGQIPPPNGTHQQPSPVIGPDGTIYLGTENGSIYAISSAGTILWNYPAGARVLSSPAISDVGALYLEVNTGEVLALGPGGNRLWSYLTSGLGESSPVLALDGTVYVGAGFGLYAITNGVRRWSTLGTAVSCSPALAADGTVYFGTVNFRQIMAYTAAGSNIWSYPVPAEVYSSPAIGEDGTVYIGAGTNFYALYGTAGPQPSAWPMYQRDARRRGRATRRAIASPARLPGGEFAATLHVETNRPYRVEASSNLVSWEQVTNFSSSVFEVPFVDSQAGQFPQRFYRLVTP